MKGLVKQMAMKLLCVLALCAAPLSGQTFGSLIGTARDSSGAVLPRVKVTVTNEATNASSGATTNDSGTYSFTTLPPGRYQIRAELAGFRHVEINGIQLQVNQVARFDLAMEVGQVTERVEVSASLATLATDTSDVGQVINNREIVDLPLNGRQYLQLASLTNGVVTTGGAGGDSAGPNFVSQGNRAASNSYLVGGIDTRIQRNNTYGLSLSVDAIGEFKIMQNAFAAEYGRGASVVAATIKSGGNSFHGSLFEFVRNDKFDARYSYNFGRKTPLRQNMFGASVGGPIRRNKLFFFTNWEGERIRQSNVALVNQPTPAMFGGNLSSMTQVARDPDTLTPFPGNIVPTSRISQFARAAQKYYVTPGGSSLPNFNHTGITGTRRRADQGTVKIDYNITDQIRIDGFLSAYDREDFSPGINPYTGDLSTMRTLPVMGFQYTHVLRPTLLSNFRIGRYKSKIYRGQEASTPTNVTAEEFGLRNVRPEAFAYAPPGINLATFQRAGAADWQPTGATDRNDQVNETVTLTKGRHTMKFGADLRWLQYDDLGWAIQNGSYTFNGQYTGNPMADLLVGIPSFAQIALRGQGKFSYETRHGEYSFFAQDDFKVSSELTLNVGLRYELVQFPLEKNNEFANWNFEKFTMLFAGKDLPRRMIPMDRNNFGPRVGAAYNPRWSRKTVFRGGYAVMYGNFRQYEAGLQHFHPPYVNENFIGNDLPRPSYTTATLWAPPVTNLVGADFSGTTVNYLRDKVMPQIHQFNVNIQRELPLNLLLQVG
jgi:Carboxypeptidase regulatory-like domain/TonB dependent receptor